MNAAQERQLTRLLMGALVLVGSCLLLLTRRDRSPVWDRPLPVRSLPAATAARTPASPPGLDQFTAVWTRPLLSPDRRPPLRAQNSTALGSLQLTGVMLSPDVKLALLQPRAEANAAPAASSAGRPGIRVALGERVAEGDWTLVRLESRQAWFAGQGGRIVLQLVPAGSATTAPSAVALPPVPAPAADAAARRREALRQALQRLQARPLPVPATTESERGD